MVLPDGRLAVSFENGNGTGFSQARGQMLVSIFDPDAGTVQTHQAAPVVYDGMFDLPLTSDGSRQGFCNGNFRSGVDGSLAVDAANDQWWPWVTATGVGQVAVVFYDRGDPSNKLVDTALAVRTSNDEEVGWTVSKISAFSSNFDNAFFGTGAFAGDYINAAYDSAGQVHAVWTCVAPGKQDSDICIK